LIAIFAKWTAVKSTGRKVLNEFPPTFSAATALAINLENKQYSLQAHCFAREEGTHGCIGGQ
jgi:hypothetical protein